MQRRGPLLVILDRLDHLVGDAAGAVQRWAALAERACLLVTSRERLRVVGEVRCEVAPLARAALDAPRAPLDAPRAPMRHASALSEAGALLLTRARDVLGERLRETPAELEVIDRLAAHLDGLPLAIELATHRLTLMTPAELLAELRARRAPGLLSDARRGAGAGPVSLAEALDVSWTLLDEPAREALIQCAVFRGRFTLDAALAVLEAPSPDATLRQLQALVDRSLLVAGVDDVGLTPGAPDPLGRPDGYRLWLLGALQRVAEERLRERWSPARRRALEARHARYYVERYERLRHDLDASRGPLIRQHLAADRHQLMAVIERSLSKPERVDGAPAEDAEPPAPAEDAERHLLAARAARCLDPALRDTTLAERRCQLLADLLARLDPSPSAPHRHLRAELTVLTAKAEQAARHTERARERLSALLEGFAPDASASGLEIRALARAQLGAGCWTSGALKEAREHYRDALVALRAIPAPERARRVDLQRDEAIYLSNVVLLDEALWSASPTPPDPYPQIVAQLTVHLQRLEALDELRMRAMLLANLGVLHVLRGHLDLGRAAYERALASLERFGDLRQASLVRYNLGQLLQEQGDLDAAEQTLRAAHEGLASLGARLFEGRLHGARGLLAFERGQLTQAARHIEAAVRDTLAINHATQAAVFIATQAALHALGAPPAEALCEPSARLTHARRLLNDADHASPSATFIDLMACVIEARPQTPPADTAEPSTAPAAPPRADHEPALRARALIARLTDPSDPLAAMTRDDDVRKAIRLTRSALGITTTSDEAALLIAPDGRWFCPPGSTTWVDFRRRRAPRRLLLALASAHITSPGHSVSMDALLSAGWPDNPSVTPNNLHVALHTLRDAGLRDALLFRDDGWRLSAHVEVSWVHDAPPPRHPLKSN